MTTALPRAAKTSGVTEYLKLVGEAVTVEVLRRIPEGSDTDWPCPEELKTALVLADCPDWEEKEMKQGGFRQ